MIKPPPKENKPNKKFNLLLQGDTSSEEEDEKKSEKSKSESIKETEEQSKPENKNKVEPEHNTKLVNFIKRNKNFNANLSEVKNVDKVHKDPTLLNLDELSNLTGFDRSQLIKFYTLFKTLWKLTIIDEGDYDRDSPGVTLKIFRDGITELSLENKELVKKIFK